MISTATNFNKQDQFQNHFDKRLEKTDPLRQPYLPKATETVFGKKMTETDDEVNIHNKLTILSSCEVSIHNKLTILSSSQPQSESLESQARYDNNEELC